MAVGHLATSAPDYLEHLARSPSGVPTEGNDGQALHALGLTRREDEASTDPLISRQKSLALYLEGLPEKVAKPVSTCGNTAVLATCESGHAWGKVLRCGREWCPVCGKDKSESHQRRYARLIPKLQQMADLQYWVITWPDEMLPELRTKKALSKAATAITRAMKDLGYSRGIRRWHFFGDRSTRWRPHMNLLVEGGYIDRARLEFVKQSLRQVLGMPENAVINMHYVSEKDQKRKAKMLHHLRYVTRATFEDWHWDPDMVKELVRFRNTWVWGTWKNPPEWTLEETDHKLGELVALSKGTCPDCGGPLHWSGLVSLFQLGLSEEDLHDAQARGGYVRLKVLGPDDDT